MRLGLLVLLLVPQIHGTPPLRRGVAERMIGVAPRGGWGEFPAPSLRVSASPRFPQDKPAAFDQKGRLVCLLEEMKDRHGVEIAPVHEHVLGFKLEGKVPEGGFRYYTVLRTLIAEGLFVDKRFKDRDLRLLGRVFPGSAVLEVGRYHWWKAGKLQDVYYWCDVCSIKSADPGTCACCQAKVELREETSKGD